MSEDFPYIPQMKIDAEFQDSIDSLAKRIFFKDQDTITLTLTREPAELLLNGIVTEEIQKQIKEKLK